MKKLVYLLFITVILFSSCPSTVRADDGVAEFDGLAVHFIDVGQGDACIVELPDDRTMLIDAGENKSEVRTKLDNYIKENIKDDNGKPITYFDFVIMTHSDSDHIGSMDYMLKHYPAKTTYRPNQECSYIVDKDSGEKCSDHANEGEQERNCFWGDDHGEKATATYHKVLEAAYKYSDEVIVTNPYDDSQNVIRSTSDDNYEINFYSPLSPDYSDNNNYSPIIVIEYEGKKIVLSGDAEKENEAEFVTAAKAGQDRYSVFDDNFCADVIKLGHHGSRTSSSEDYLNVMTAPSGVDDVFVVISCGEGNSYGHPHKEVLERLNKLGFSNDKILRTDLAGDVRADVSDKNGELTVTHTKEVNTAKEPKKDMLSIMKDRFLALPLFVKVIIIVVVVAIVILVLAFLIKFRKKKKRRRKRR